MELDTRIDNLKEVIRKTPYDLLQEHVYTCVANSCLLLTAHKHKKGAKGWSRALVDDSGQPMLTYKQQEMLESAFAKAPWISEALDTQEDDKSQDPWEMIGGNPLPTLTTSSDTIFAKDAVPFLPNSDDLSLDTMLNTFLKKSDEMDVFWTRFAHNSPGFSKLLNRDITVPYVPVPVPVRPLVNFLVLLIDSIRLSAGLAGIQSTALSLIVMIEELVTGQWRQMMLTGLGFISPSGMAAGVVLKYIINAWTLINPELRDQIFKDMLKGTKSLMIGFLLWASTTLPPQTVKNQIEGALQKARTMVQGVDAKVKELEEKGSKALKPLGKRIQFTGINLNRITKISLQDIQNLQALAQWDLLVCSSEFQSILQPLIKEPILRLVIELFNIPTLSDDIYRLCGPQPYKPIAEKVVIAFEPQIIATDEPTAADIAEAAAEIKKEEAEVKKEETEVKEAEVKEEAAKVKEEAAEVKEEAAKVKEEAAEVKEEAANVKQGVTEVKKGSNVKQEPVKGGHRKAIRLRAKSVKGRRATPRRITRRA